MPHVLFPLLFTPIFLVPCFPSRDIRSNIGLPNLCPPLSEETPTTSSQCDADLKKLHKVVFREKKSNLGLEALKTPSRKENHSGGRPRTVMERHDGTLLIPRVEHKYVGAWRKQANSPKARRAAAGPARIPGLGAAGRGYPAQTGQFSERTTKGDGSWGGGGGGTCGQPAYTSLF